MKLLLTSHGIYNQKIADALVEMVGKAIKGIRVGFIPTAVNVDGGNKDWFIEQLTDLQKFGFAQIDIIEIASEYVDWQSKLQDVDVIYAGGGNPYYLLEMMRRINFGDWLRQNLGQKVYVGGSAGAIVVTPSIGAAKIKTFGSKNVPKISDLSGLVLVDFEVVPHVPDWPSYQEAEDYAKTTSNAVYAMDNQTGIKVEGGNIEVVSEGKWKKYN